MLKNWKSIVLICVLLLFWVTTLAFILLQITNNIQLFVDCFSVDSAGRVYIAAYERIEVYENGVAVNAIDIPTSRGYTFAITGEDEIILFAGHKMYTLDLHGNIISVSEDNGGIREQIVSSGKNTHISTAGDAYQLTHLLGRTRIVKNGAEVVYSISLFSFVMKMLLYVTSTAFVVSIVCLCVEKYKKR